MAFSPLIPFRSPFVEAPFQEREKGFGERLVDDISNLSLRQGLGLPFTGPAQFAAGALKGASFGLIDFGEELGEALGEFGLPETITSSLDIAGEIGGSFIPFVGSSLIAHKLFTGLSLGAKLARGATTFGAPELARQALTQELSPQAGLRSLATGAAFALPLPRVALAPAVAGTELLFGADPLAATAAGLFAGLFGSMSRTPRGLHAEVPPSPRQLSRATESGGNIGSMARQKASLAALDEQVVSAPSHFTPGRPMTQGNAQPLPEGPRNVLRELMDQPELVSPRQRKAAAAGQLEFVFPAGGAKTQAQLLNEVAIESSGRTSEAAKTLANRVTQQAERGQLQLSLELDNAVLARGPGVVETRILHQALAESKREFVPPQAPVTNPLMKIPNARGVDMVEPGLKNPFEIRANLNDMLATMEAGPPAAQLKAAQIRQIVSETQDLVRRARGKGKEPEPGVVAAQTIKLEAALASQDAALTTPDSAVTMMREMMNQKLTPESALALAKSPPAELLKIFPDGKKKFQQLAEDRAQVLKYVFSETGAQRLKFSTTSPELNEFRRASSDHGMEVIELFKPGTLQLSLSGQNVRKFKSSTEGQAWLQALENGKVDPTNIHELRALAHARSISVTYNGNGSVTLTNTMSGETPAPFESLAAAVKAVRQAPNVASASREIGPLVPKGNPPLPGTGSIGSIAAEQPPPASLGGCASTALPEVL